MMITGDLIRLKEIYIAIETQMVSVVKENGNKMIFGKIQNNQSERENRWMNK